MQPLKSVTITVYVVLAVGVAVTVEPVVALNPVEGLQAYVVPPAAVSVELPPRQTDAGEAVAVAMGLELTVTVTVAVFVHPFAFVPITV